MGVILFAACGGTDATKPDTTYPASIDVFTPGNIFSPPTAEIRAGGVVRFLLTQSPEGDGHNANFSPAAGAPANIPVLMDTTVTRQFNTGGTFSYVCTVHPGMVGEVIVH